MFATDLNCQRANRKGLEMQLRTWPLLTVLAFITCTSFAHKISDSAWQKGTLKDIQFIEESAVTGSLYEGNGSLSGGTYAVQHFIIESPQMIYDVVPAYGKTSMAVRKGRFDFTVNLSYSFAIEKSDMYLRDANGKEGKFRIVKKTLKQPMPVPEVTH